MRPTHHTRRLFVKELARDTSGTKYTAQLVQELGDRCPAAMLDSLSVLFPLLDGEVCSRLLAPCLSAGVLQLACSTARRVAACACPFFWLVYAHHQLETSYLSLPALACLLVGAPWHDPWCLTRSPPTRAP